jgi:crotonobetainyl-CoA:carnitine CoA-transferase CaiB-like acyl-CoA transferase
MDITGHEGGELVRSPISPIEQTTGCTHAIKLPPPMLGEHSREVLREIGYADGEFAVLGGSRVVLDGAG